MDAYDKYMILSELLVSGGIDRIGVTGDDGAEPEPNRVNIAGPVATTWLVSTGTGIATLQSTPIQFAALSGIATGSEAYYTELFNSSYLAVADGFAADIFTSTPVQNGDIVRIMSATLEISD